MPRVSLAAVAPWGQKAPREVQGSQELQDPKEARGTQDFKDRKEQKENRECQALQV